MALAPLILVDPADAVLGKRWDGSDGPGWRPSDLGEQTRRTHGRHAELCV